MDFIDHRSTAKFIFKTSATDEKARIDDSGNFLTGKTASNFSIAGAEVRNLGNIWATRDGGTPLALNRLSSEGAIAQFYKDGGSLGVIASVDSDFVIYSAISGHTGLRFGEGWIGSTNNAGTLQNGTVSLGTTSYRWSDLFLSGAANIGGNANITGNATITGNLTVSGTTTTINTATLDVEDKNITLNYGSGDTSALADGAGITIQDAVDASNNATLLWDQTNSEWDFSHDVTAPNLNISNWDAAYSWGDHASAGYLTSQTSHADVVVDGDFTSSGLMKRGSSAGSYSVITDNSSNWDAAYDWGDHSTEGYLTSSDLAGYLTAEADTLSTVTGRGATTTNAISTGAITSSGAISAQNSLTVQNQTAYGVIEVGGVSGGFIDIKRPFSDDFDLRLIAEGNGGVINVASGELTIQRAGSAKLATTNTGIDVTGDIAVSGTVDGRNLSTDGTKLDAIEANATADQTAAEIKALVGSATDSNVFTDADHTKLDGIEANATADQTAAEIRALVEAASNSNVFTDADHTKLDGIEASANVTDAANVAAAGALMDSEVTNLAQVKAFDSADYATAAQGATANAALPRSGGAMTGAITTNSTFDGRDVATDGAKLDGIESGATADQTAAEIRALVESATNSNVFTDADHTKLNGIEASANVTDTANVTAAGALMDSELTSQASVKGLNQGVATTNSPSFAGLTVDTNTLHIDSTNNRVGIGTLSPAIALDIVDTSSDVQMRVYKNDGTKNTRVTLTADDSGAKLHYRDANNAGALRFNNNLGEVMRITANTTRVGIGLSSPSTALDVNGVVTATGIDVSSNITVDGTVDGRDVAADGSKLDGIESGANVTDTANVVSALTAGTNITIAANGTISSTDTNTQLSTEQVQDIVGAMFSGNTETRIAATYQDGDGTIDLVVDNMNQSVSNATITISAGTDLTGGGNFTTNQGSAETITINHEDVSSQGSVNNSNGTVIQDVTLNANGHVTALGSVNLDSRYTSLDHFRHTGHGNYTSTTTSALLTEALGDDAFDSKLTAHKTSWNYAGNGDLTDAGRLTELAGTSWLWWTDNSTDNVQGNVTALAIAPNTGGSAGKVFIYNDQGSSYSPGWREVWTSTSDGAGSGLDADLLDGQQGSYYLNYNNLSNTPSIPSVANATITITAGTNLTGGGNFTTNQSGNETITINHEDVSSQGSVNNSGGTVIQDVTLNANGHVTALGSVNLDTRYYTESESDGRFARLTGATFTGNVTLSGADGENALTLSGTSPTMAFTDSGSEDDFYIHVNSNNLYILADRDGNGAYGVWDSPHPLQLEADTNIGYLFGNRIFADNYHPNADAWTTSRTLSLTGDVTGSASIDGSANASISSTLATPSDAPGSWQDVVGWNGGLIKDAAVEIHGSGYLRASYLNMTHGVGTRSSDTVFYSSTDDYIRKTNATGMRAALAVPTRTGGDASGTWGISITGDAGTVDGLNASSFIRSDADDDVNGHTEWQDNKNVRFGNSADLRIYHDGSDHYFRNYNHANGNFYFQGEDLEGSNHALLYLITNTSRPYVRLFENGGERLKTTSTGVDLALGMSLAGTTVIDSSRNLTNIGTISSGAITSSGTIRSADGTNTAPGYRFTSDTDTGMFRATTNALAFSTAGTERTRLDASGNQLWGKTAANNTTQGIRFLGSAGFMSVVRSNATAIIVNRIDSNGTLMEFRVNGTTRGSISISGTTTSYNTTSDERAKENIVDAPSASDDIDAIRVRSFDFKADGSHQKYGMVAQELGTVAPEAVSVPDDAEEMQSVDYSKLVPMMLKEIQTLRARVAQLEGEN